MKRCHWVTTNSTNDTTESYGQQLWSRIDRQNTINGNNGQNIEQNADEVYEILL